jgi:hypothetical protein
MRRYEWQNLVNSLAGAGNVDFGVLMGQFVLLAIAATEMISITVPTALI